MLPKIPENNFVVFVSNNPDKRKKLYKTLLQTATVKTYSAPSNAQMEAFIREEIPTIDTKSLQTLFAVTQSSVKPAFNNASAAESLMSEHFERLAEEVEKWKLFAETETITPQIIHQYTQKHIDESVFALSDAIMALNRQKALHALAGILEHNSVHMVLAMLLSSLRKALYILALAKNGTSPAEIASILGIHPFVVKKSIDYLQNAPRLFGFFAGLAIIDREVKTGVKIGQDSDESIILRLQTELARI